MLRLWGKTDRCQSAFLTCDEPLLICSAMHEDAQFRVQRLMQETGTPRDRCRCLVGILAGMRRWWTEGLGKTEGPEHQIQVTGAGKKYGFLGMVGACRVDGRTGCKMRDDEMRCAKGDEEGRKGEMRLVWNEMKMVVGQVSEVVLSIDA